MPGETAGAWLLADFEEHFHWWVDQESPSQHLRVTLLSWILSRHEDPYQGVRRQRGFENLWFGAVPGTDHGDFQVVACSYFIAESEHAVICNSISTLSRPV
jgi:hypothetical protein